MIETRTFFQHGRTALVVVDLQRGIVSGDVKPRSGAEVVGTATRLANAFRNAKLPVMFTRVSFGPQFEDALKPIVDEPPALPQPFPGWDEIVPEVGLQQNDIVVTKRAWGAFYGTDLDLQLRRRNVACIAICGISTNIGVESTARDAYERNYKLLFIEDAMSAMTTAEHEHSLHTTFPRMGIIRSEEQVLAAL